MGPLEETPGTPAALSLTWVEYALIFTAECVGNPLPGTGGLD